MAGSSGEDSREPHRQEAPARRTGSTSRDTCRQGSARLRRTRHGPCSSGACAWVSHPVRRATACQSPHPPSGPMPFCPHGTQPTGLVNNYTICRGMVRRLAPGGLDGRARLGEYNLAGRGLAALEEGVLHRQVEAGPEPWSCLRSSRAEGRPGAVRTAGAARLPPRRPSPHPGPLVRHGREAGLVGGAHDERASQCGKSMRLPPPSTAVPRELRFHRCHGGYTFDAGSPQRPIFSGKGSK